MPLQENKSGFPQYLYKIKYSLSYTKAKTNKIITESENTTIASTSIAYVVAKDVNEATDKLEVNISSDNIVYAIYPFKLSQRIKLVEYVEKIGDMKRATIIQ